MNLLPLIITSETILYAVSSLALVERVFSTFGHVHSNLRNKLGLDKHKNERFYTNVTMKINGKFLTVLETQKSK